uniref:Uncharacterized protein n=1 Tax=Panagrolaimus sp. JU765 TaxID=591449 RepID=A0AC34PVJ3_9BILA
YTAGVQKVIWSSIANASLPPTFITSLTFNGVLFVVAISMIIAVCIKTQKKSTNRNSSKKDSQELRRYKSTSDSENCADVLKEVLLTISQFGQRINEKSKLIYLKRMNINLKLTTNVAIDGKSKYVDLNDQQLFEDPLHQLYYDELITMDVWKELLQ